MKREGLVWFLLEPIMLVGCVPCGKGWSGLGFCLGLCLSFVFVFFIFVELFFS